jgi:hypothetical protein
MIKKTADDMYKGFISFAKPIANPAIEPRNYTPSIKAYMPIIFVKLYAIKKYL